MRGRLPLVRLCTALIVITSAGSALAQLAPPRTLEELKQKIFETVTLPWVVRRLMPAI
jgi:hypothetical protein